LFTVLLALQLRFSRRARGYAVRAVLVIGFGATFTGFIGTLALLAIKLQMHRKHTAKLEL